LASLVVIASADEDVRSTQEELRRRNIYFGDIDGRASPELQEALKRYQKRKGLAASGDSDRDTLRSLGIVSRAPGEPLPKEVQLPDEPVLKSDVRINVSEEAQEVAADTGVSVASLTPPKGASTFPRSLAHHRAAARGTDTTEAGAPRKGPHFSVRDDARLKQELQQYVHDYLKAVGGNHLQDELRFYADRVDYLGNGWVDRRVIESSLRKYYQRWPHRDYSNLGNIEYRSEPARGEIVLRFQTTFGLRNGSTHAHGRSENEMVINAATADPRIVSISERRIRF
jgi:peptidoglycan hydrolase-like protein with peptidoglycan-binding domain